MSTPTNAHKRTTLAKFSLAGIAVLGIGAAATAAAWTDDVWFTAEAEAATFDLQGSVDGSTWLDVGVDPVPDDPDDDVAIVIPATEFAGIGPDYSHTTTLYLKNAGTSDITLAGPNASDTGAIFEGTDGATVVVSPALTGTVLTPDEQVTFNVTVETSADWPLSYQGTTGTITVQVTGTAS
ncbi:hypothetical protein [Demequina sp.]|uniref:hypothetical protein n=1 Tax=Demequina sp. TaxID=2050685 RepID=UPI003A86636C